MSKKIIIVILVMAAVIIGAYKLIEKSVTSRETFNFETENTGKNFVETQTSFSYEKLKNMALDYFFSNNLDLLPKEKYSAGVSDKVIKKYENKNMVVIEIRHIHNSFNNTLDARYYINIFTAKGYDDLGNEIDLNNLK